MTDKARIAVMVSGGGTNLQALIDAQNSGEPAAAFHDVTVSVVNAVNFRHAPIRRLENAQPARQSFKKGSAVFKEEVYSHEI